MFDAEEDTICWAIATKSVLEEEHRGLTVDFGVCEEGMSTVKVIRDRADHITIVIPPEFKDLPMLEKASVGKRIVENIREQYRG